VAKLALFTIIGVVLAVLFLPSVGRFLTRLGVSSETIVVPSTGPGDAGIAPGEGLELELVTLLGFDAIPAILKPDFVSADEADSRMDPEEQVLGLSINGDNRAYSIPQLSRHEIVNDVVGGVPVAITW
jgi:hypothetical protein